MVRGRRSRVCSQHPGCNGPSAPSQVPSSRRPHGRWGTWPKGSSSSSRRKARPCCCRARRERKPAGSWSRPGQVRAPGPAAPRAGRSLPVLLSSEESAPARLSSSRGGDSGRPPCPLPQVRRDTSCPSAGAPAAPSQASPPSLRPAPFHTQSARPALPCPARPPVPLPELGSRTPWDGTDPLWPSPEVLVITPWKGPSCSFCLRWPRAGRRNEDTRQPSCVPSTRF